MRREVTMRGARSSSGRGWGCILRGVLGVLALLAPVAACVPAGEATDAGPPDAAPYIGPSTALFELPRGGGATQPSEYYALPFPNDLRVREGGTLDLDEHVRPNALIELYLDTISSRFDGFSTNAAAFFRFSDPFDTSTLPASPEAARAASASVYLVDVDPDSPERGTRRPLRFRFEDSAGETIGPNWLSCLPYPGFPMRPRTTYALVVTTRLAATDGGQVARAPDFAALAEPAASAEPDADADVTAARAVYAPLFTWLDEPGGDERADVVAAAVFTTQDPTQLLGRMRAVIHATVAAPTLAAIESVATTSPFSIFTATYETPIFQSGESPYLQTGGEILVDGTTGDPILQRLESIRVAMTFPPGAVPAGGWPVVLYAHGTGGDYKSFIRDGTAARFAAHGFAVLGTDQILNGTRVAEGSSSELLFYNFQNPLAGRDNSRQGAADNYQLVRVVAAVAVSGVSPDDRQHHLDSERIYFMGHSQGGITGPLAVAYEPDIRGAIFSGSGGLLYWALLLKTEPVDIPGLLMGFLRDYPLDEFNNVLALVQLFIEPADPINYARLLTHEPPPGVALRDIYQSQGLIDHYTPPPAIEALGVGLGGSPVGPLLEPLEGFALAGRPVLTPPVTRNLGERTVVFHQYRAAAGSDGHFVVFDDPLAQRQHVQFLVTLDADGVATLVP